MTNAKLFVLLLFIFPSFCAASDSDWFLPGLPQFRDSSNDFVRYNCKKGTWERFPLPVAVNIPKFPMITTPDQRGIFTDGYVLFELLRRQDEPNRLYCRIAMPQRSALPGQSAWIWGELVGLPSTGDATQVYGFLDHSAVIGYLRVEKKGIHINKYFCYGKLDLLNGKLIEMAATEVTGRYFKTRSFQTPSNIYLFLSDGRIAEISEGSASVRFHSRLWTDGLRFPLSPWSETPPYAKVLFASVVFADCSGRLHVVAHVDVLLSRAEAEAEVDSMPDKVKAQLKRENRWPPDLEQISDQKMVVIRYDPSTGEVDQLDDEACTELYKIDSIGHQIEKRANDTFFYYIDGQGKVRPLYPDKIKVVGETRKQPEPSSESAKPAAGQAPKPSGAPVH